MDYKTAFWMLVASAVTYVVSRTTVYIGHDEAKYNAANIGFLIQKRRP